MHFCVKLSLSTLPFLLHWLRWPCLLALIVSFWRLKDARWALDVLKRQTVKPVCEWQITSLAFLWLEKTLNKLSMCSTARWRVHWLRGCIWIALRDAALCVEPWLCVCVCVWGHLVRSCFYSQCSRPGVLLCDRIGADQCSLTEQLTWGKTLFSARRPHLFLAFLLLRSDSYCLWPRQIAPQANELMPPSPLFFSSFRSLTQSVSFCIVLSVQIPCGRAVYNKCNRINWLHTLVNWHWRAFVSTKSHSTFH